MTSSGPRLLVMGRSGAGKSTLARRIGAVLDLPVVHLDALYWRSDWTPVEPELFAERQRAAIAGDRWVVDGNYTSVPECRDRLEAATGVIVVEAPLAVCLGRVMRRWARHRGRPRVDLGPDGPRERVSAAFLWWMATWHRNHPDLPGEIAALAPELPILVSRDGSLDRILEWVEEGAPPG
jgi:adenylate kinase family enzyme